jgi:hypothetical protein
MQAVRKDTHSMTPGNNSMFTYFDEVLPRAGSVAQAIKHLTRSQSLYRRLGAGVYLMTAKRIPDHRPELNAVISMLSGEDVHEYGSYSVNPLERRHFTGWADVLPPDSGRW